MSDPTLDTVVGVYFSLEIDSADLGIFSSCNGLGLDMQITQREDGGGGLTVHQLPGRFRYTNLQVTRPIGPETAKTMAWLQQMSTGISPSNARLAALDPAGNLVFAWTLTGVLPARWTGPSFDVANPQPATETLELAYTSIMLGES
jgi:phage tail-like protein